MTQSYPSSQELMDRAEERMGLDDFGAPAFRDGLEVMLESLAVDAPYGPQERAAAVDLIGRRLDNRLAVEAWHAAHPDAGDTPIESPVSIVGLPRTGTTALGNMLSLDPQFRPLRPWEQEQPCPPPHLDDEAHDPRRLAYRDRIETLLHDRPDLGAMHIWETDATMEDTEILGLSFRSQQMTMPIWSYHAWWRQGDMRETFRYHARVMRLLQAHRPPNRWLFKAPHHKFHLDHMADAYPGIRFIFTHRDPAKSVPSYVSFVTALLPEEVVARLGRDKIGREIHAHLLDGMHRAMAAREKLGPDRFFDVRHADLVERPFEVLDRLYDWLDLPLTGGTRAAFETWQAKHASGSHGTHRYEAEAFGLHPQEIREQYNFYLAERHD